jgi:hypothetical protein
MKTNSQQLDFGLIVLDPQEHRIQSARKQRKCLSCSDSFESHGPGNRVCPACKDLDAWTSPVEFSVHASF